MARYSGVANDQVSGVDFAITPGELEHSDKYEVSAYRRGPIKIAAGYVDFNLPNLSSWDGTQQTVGTLAVTPVVAGGYALAAHQRIATVFGTYDLHRQADRRRPAHRQKGSDRGGGSGGTGT